MMINLIIVDLIITLIFGNNKKITCSKKINDKNVNEEEFTKGLRYDEYIADIVATCQYQKQQIDEMKKEEL